MIYHSIRAVTSYLLLEVLMLALPGYAQQAQKAPTPQQPSIAKPSPEFLDACKLELQRIMGEALKGAGASFSSTDEAMMDTCRAVAAAGKANRIASRPSRFLKSRVKSELIEQARETSSRMIAEFNQKGVDTRFSSSDRNEVGIFVGVATAIEVLQMANSPAVTKDISSEVVVDAKKSAEEMISKFNENGYGASFSSWEVEPLNSFLDAVEEKGKQGKK